MHSLLTRIPLTIPRLLLAFLWGLPSMVIGGEVAKKPSRSVDWVVAERVITTERPWGIYWVAARDEAPPVVSADVNLAELESRVDQLFAEWDSTHSPGCAVGVVRRGELIFAKGYGMASLEYGVPITPATRFDTASVGKQFTTYAILKLADQGKLGLDDPVREHLPEFPEFDRPITIRHLIHHTSGIRDYFTLLELTGKRPQSDSITQQDVLKILWRQRELNFPPATEMLYCNSGYVLLAEIIERVSKTSLRAWLDEHAFRPLGMHDTELGDDFTRIIPRVATSYAPQSPETGGFRRAVTNYAAYGPGITYTTVGDLAKWVAAFGQAKHGNGNEIFQRMQVRGSLNNGEQLDYAFGISHGQHRGLPLLRHGGSWAGFRTHVAWFPEQDLGVIVLSNVASFNAQGKAMELAEVYLGDEMEPAPPVPESGSNDDAKPKTDPPFELTIQVLQTFAGRYESLELDTAFMLSLVGEQLVARHPRHDDIILTPTKEDEFSGRIFGMVRFERDDDNRVVGFRANSSRARNVLFQRRD